MASTPPTYNSTAKILKLPRLPVGWKDQPQLFERYWDEAMSSIEKSLNGLLVLPLIQQALADAQAATQEALAAADNANGATTAQAKEASLVNSYPQAIGTGAVITASSDGVVTIATHNRVYGNSGLNPTVSVTGASISTTATSDNIVRVYYVDPERDGGAVSYQYTIDPADFPAQGSDVHSVGAVQIPATGTTPGRIPGKPGYVEFQRDDPSTVS